MSKLSGLTGPTFALALIVACGDMDDASEMNEPSSTTGSVQGVQDPATARAVRVDRFSKAAGHLQVHDDTNGLPAAGQAIDFDRGPFITRGLGPTGQHVAYYNFDVQPLQPAPIYVLFRTGESQPVEGQLNIVDVIPGASGYNDFWQVWRVTVPASYVANTASSLADLKAAGYALAATEDLVNCPIVPAGSTAHLRLGGESPELTRGWYRGQLVYYFNFSEHQLSGAAVPVAPIYVTFNINPDKDGGGPPSGFRTEPNSEQTHNILGALPMDAGYSPLWSVSPYDNADFAKVQKLTDARAAHVLGNGVANVNCPVVEIDP